MRKVSDNNCRGNHSTHFVFNIFFSKIVPFYEIMWKKYCTAGHATDDNMAHARCMLDTYGYKYTLTIYNTYCFSTATMVELTHLNVTLYVHCLSCLYFVLLLCGHTPYKWPTRRPIKHINIYAFRILVMKFNPPQSAKRATEQ
jgi:hypothetical protein